MEFEQPPSSPLAHGDTADSLREQAAACRRLAPRARTRAGMNALNSLGDHFDERASLLDPLSLRR